MQDLIKQIVEKTGIPADKAQQVLGVVAGFVKEKFPMIGGQLDSLLGTDATKPAAAGENQSGGDMLDDIKSKLGF